MCVKIAITCSRIAVTNYMYLKDFFVCFCASDSVCSKCSYTSVSLSVCVYDVFCTVDLFCNALLLCKSLFHIFRVLAATTIRELFIIGRSKRDAFLTAIPFTSVKIWKELRTQSLRHLTHGRYANRTLNSTPRNCLLLNIVNVNTRRIQGGVQGAAILIKVPFFEKNIF